MKTQPKTQAANVSLAAAQESASTPSTLTVIVTNNENQRAQGARVSLEPSGVSGVTDSTGEVQLKLGTASKYNVTVNLDGNKVTVPYYVTKNGATRLVVNPTYVKTVEAAAAKNQQGSIDSQTGIIFGAIAVLLVLVILWKFVRR